MAITVTQIASATSNDGGPYVTASFTRTAGRLYLAACHAYSFSATAGTFTPPSGWDEVVGTSGAGGRLYNSDTNRVQVFRCLLGADSTGTQSFSSSNSGVGGHVDILEIQGMDTTGTNGSGAIVQAVDGSTTGDDPNTWNLTLAALGDAANNAVVSFFTAAGASTFAPSSGYTEAYDGAGTESAALSGNYAVPGTTTPGTTNSSGFLDGGGFGIEIKSASSGITLGVDQTTLSFSGQNVTLTYLADVVLPVDVNSATFSGQSIDFSYGVEWLEGSLTFSGQDVTLLTAGGVTLVVTEATLSFTGQDITLGGTAVLNVDTGTLTFTGQGVTLTQDFFVLPVGEASAQFTGQAISLLNSQSIPYVGSRISVLQISSSGKVQWRDYIPVKYKSLPDTSNINRTNSGGALAVSTLSSGSGLVEWKDYKPVVVVAYSDSNEWRFDDLGFIPIVEVS